MAPWLAGWTGFQHRQELLVVSGLSRESCPALTRLPGVPSDVPLPPRVLPPPAPPSPGSRGHGGRGKEHRMGQHSL